MSAQGTISISTVTTAEDVSIIKELFLEYAASLNLDLTFQSFTEELAALPGLYSPPRGNLFLARSSTGAALACVALRPLVNEPGACEIKRLYVRSEARGSALGQRLARTVIEYATSAGYVRARLDTLESMTAAQKLYLKLGFTKTKPYYSSPVPGMVFMVLDMHEVKSETKQ